MKLLAYHIRFQYSKMPLIVSDALLCGLDDAFWGLLGVCV